MIKAIYNRQLNGKFTPKEHKLIGGLVEDKFFTLKKSSYTSVKLHDIQTKSVFAVAFSHDGTLVASTHADHTIRVLFYEPFGLTHTLRGHVRSPISLQFHPKNRYILASGCLAGQVFLWNLQSMMGTKMHQLCPFLQQPTTHEVMHSVVHLPIGSIAFHPNGRHLVASRCRQLTLWDIESKQPSQPINTVFTEHESERIRGVLFDPYGRYLVTAIRRVVPTPVIPAAAAPVPEVKVETWTPKRPKTGRYSKLNTVKNALNKLIYAGQKRSFSTATSGASQDDEGSPGPSTRSSSGGDSSAPRGSSTASPAAGRHSPQPRLDSTETTTTQTASLRIDSTTNTVPPRPDSAAGHHGAAAAQDHSTSQRAAHGAAHSATHGSTHDQPATQRNAHGSAQDHPNGQRVARGHTPVDLPSGNTGMFRDPRLERTEQDQMELRLQSRSLCTNCQAGAFSKHVVQVWDFEDDVLPDIRDADHNIITNSAIMVTNVNLQVSPDGSFVCLVEKEDCGGGATLYLTVYSLSPDTFKQCLMRTCVKYIPMCISITPFNQYIVAFARHTDGRENHAGMIITYEIPRKKFSDKQRMTRSMTKPPSSTPKFNQISIHDEMPINIARFGHLPWQGTVIGTCSGKLYLMRVGPRQIQLDAVTEPGANSS